MIASNHFGITEPRTNHWVDTGIRINNDLPKCWASIIDELSDDEDEDIDDKQEEVFFRETQLSTFLKMQKSSSGKGKAIKGTTLTINYQEILEVPLLFANICFIQLF